MSNILLLIKYLPQLMKVIKSIQKNIRVMADDGIDEKEIKDALEKIELAFAITDDSVVESDLNKQWVSDVEEREIPPPLPVDKGTKSES